MTCLSSCADNIATLQQEVAYLKAQSESLQDKSEDLESRSRQNIKIVGVPESQGSTTAISVLLQKAFSLTEATVLDRSHHTTTTSDQPCVNVTCLHYFQDCTNILSLARKKQQIKVNRTRISVYTDYTARVAREQAGYNGVRQQLQGLEGVCYGILHSVCL